jgi:DNA-binding NarL/FixJ family response regulator
MSDVPANSTVRVVLVDDHQLVRSGVRAELDAADVDGSVEVVGEAGEVDEAIRVITTLKPDVVLLDVHMPGGGGAEVIRGVHEGLPAVRFLALSVSDAAEDVIGVVRAGARGYVTKAIDGPALTDAIRRVASGDAVFGPRLAGFVLDAFSGSDAATPPAGDDLDALTPREREVLRLIARGYTYREAAQELVQSDRTIETHESTVLRKLQLSNRRELARWASARHIV